MEDWRGKILSKVKILDLLARGGMAQVYVGEHISLNQPRAVKILHDHLTEDPEIQTRFRAEAQSLATLRHQNIVQVFDCDLVQNRPYMVMELIKGDTLASHLARLKSQGQSLPLETISQWITSLSKALDYAHARGIVHRDIKPANILLRIKDELKKSYIQIPSGLEPVLSDFGVAHIAGQTTHTAVGTILGTPAYMSPEQISSNPVDARSDIYSLGVVLYEMLAGKTPFEPSGDTPVSILYKHIHESPPPLPNVNPSLQAVVQKALAKNPKDRYQSASELAYTLHTAIEHDRSVTIRSLRPALKTGKIPSTPFRVEVVDSPAKKRPQKKFSNTLRIAALTLAVVAMMGGIFIIGSQFLNNITRSGSFSTDLSTPIPSFTETPQGTQEAPLPVSGIQSTPILPLEVIQITGRLSFKDDSVQATLYGLDDPGNGRIYRAWLLGLDQTGLEVFVEIGHVDNISHESDTVSLDYLAPSQENLLASYNAFILSLDLQDTQATVPGEIVYQAQIDPETITRFQWVDDVNRGSPISKDLINWLSRQSQHFASHANTVANNLQNDNLSGAKSHAEHTLNIIDGQMGDLYGDWDGNGRIDNPGDDVGLLNYLLVLQDILRSDEANRTISKGLDGIIDWLTSMRETARQVVLADSIDLIQEIGLDEEIASVQDLKIEMDALITLAQGLDLTYYLDLTTVE